ncbi:hypothetical protein [Virgisporangium aurantiacum]|uniref:hypothetical protein n=1 Tax=Virgisporangium aurantiacum TaxID=175570 RepID=UPI00194E9557|nr:hypothetical protein [Virgisporangium aurantiacum]
MYSIGLPGATTGHRRVGAGIRMSTTFSSTASAKDVLGWLDEAALVSVSTGTMGFMS